MSLLGAWARQPGVVSQSREQPTSDLAGQTSTSIMEAGSVRFRTGHGLAELSPGSENPPRPWDFLSSWPFFNLSFQKKFKAVLEGFHDVMGSTAPGCRHGQDLTQESGAQGPNPGSCANMPIPSP